MVREKSGQKCCDLAVWDSKAHSKQTIHLFYRLKGLGLLIKKGSKWAKNKGQPLSWSEDKKDNQ